MLYNFYLTFFYLIAIGLIYYYSIFLYKYTIIGISKVFDGEIIWNKYIEKPRLLIYTISFYLTWLALTTNESISSIQTFSKITILLSSLLLVWLSNTKIFIKTLSKDDINKKNKTTKLIINPLQTEDVSYILREFKKYEICNNDVALNEFLNTLKFDKSSNGIILNMNNSSIKIFHNYLFIYFDLSLNLKEFLTSKSFLTKKGKEYNYNAVKNSKKTLPNFKHRLKDIFNNLPNNN